MRALVRTIPRRAALAALAGLVAGILVLAVAAPGLADRHDAETLEAWLGSEARLAGDLARDGLRARDPNVLDPLAHRVASSAAVRVTFIDTTGVVLGESDEDRTTMDNHASRPEVAAALAGNEGGAPRLSATVQRDLLYVAARPSGTSGEPGRAHHEERVPGASDRLAGRRDRPALRPGLSRASHLHAQRPEHDRPRDVASLGRT